MPESSKKIPASLIIDDSGPVNMYFFHDQGRPHELLVPAAFLRDFAAAMRRHGVRGKFSMVPIPGGLGRLDGKVNLVPAGLVRDYVKIVAREIEPAFSITPEILTHHLCYNPARGRCGHVCEDVHIAGLDAEGIAEYVGLGLEILTNVGLNPTGVTSPWRCGIDNEENYARGIGMAFRRKLDRDRAFYFLHSHDHVILPTLMCDSPETGRVVSVPHHTFDAFWNTQNPATVRAARAAAREAMDRLLSPDGSTGVLRTLFEEGRPLVLISHWQSLFSDGRAIGLAGLERLVARVNRVFGRRIEWVDFEELAFPQK